jgi:ribose 5-phosphate isomerase A
MSNPDAWKRAAAAAALGEVAPGMRLGLGTGSTAARFVELLAERVRDGLDIVGVPTSNATADQARRLGVPLTTLDETPELDLTVDGADEIAPGLALVKGGGAALLNEKIVAAASKRMVVIADHAKLVPTLGAFPLPVEVAPFGLEATRRAVADAARRLGLAGEITLRRRGDAIVSTDGGHSLLDCAFGAIPDPAALAAALDRIPGVMGHGLFLGLCSLALIAGPGGVERLTPRGPERT